MPDFTPGSEFEIPESSEPTDLFFGYRLSPGVHYFGLDLRHADLPGRALFDAVFKESRFVWVNFSRTCLYDVMLEKCQFKNVSFANSLIAGATFKKFDKLDNASFSYAKTTSDRFVTFDSGELTKCDFSRADIPGAHFLSVVADNCWFKSANLSGLNAKGCSFVDCDFTNASLEGANLENAVLTGSRFVGANLKNANLTGANLREVDLTGADLTGTVMDDSALKGAIASNTTYDRSSCKVLMEIPVKSDRSQFTQLSIVLFEASKTCYIVAFQRYVTESDEFAESPMLRGYLYNELAYSCLLEALGDMKERISKNQ